MNSCFQRYYSQPFILSCDSPAAYRHRLLLTQLWLSYDGMNSFHSQFLENSQNLMCKHNDSVLFLEMTVNSNIYFVYFFICKKIIFILLLHLIIILIIALGNINEFVFSMMFVYIIQNTMLLLEIVKQRNKKVTVKREI